MSPSSPKGDLSPSQTIASGSAEDPKDTKQYNTPRRRTKTGCLTCRRRRIKCGEERPICKNCVKSKRECAGYVQPLVYKQQQQQQHSSSDNGRTRINSSQGPEPTYYPLQASGGDDFTSTQRYLPTDRSHPSHYPGIPQSSFAWGWPPLPTTRALAEQLQWPETENDWLDFQHGKAHPPLHLNTNFQAGTNPPPLQFSNILYDPGRRPSEALTDATVSSGPGSAPRSTVSTPYRQHTSTTEASSAQIPLDSISSDPATFFGGTHESNFPGEHSHQSRRMSQFSIDGDRSVQYDNYGFLKRRLTTQSDHRPSPQTSNPLDVDVDIEDPDDPFDIDVEDAPDFADEVPNQAMQWLPQRYGRSHGGPANTLVHHHKFRITSPLLDERYSHLFNHFVSYLVYCVGAFERAPKMVVNGFRKSTWGFHLPSAAVSRSALAYAILAISALHLSILHGTSEDTAVKHFTYALRRLGKLLAMPTRRHEPATLATVLLLSFYEVISGDHSRWIVHLSGAGSFLMEHDFAAMARAVRRMRVRARRNVEQPWVAQHGSLSRNDYVRIADIPEALLHDEDWDVDSQLISSLMGIDVDYDHQYQPGLHAQNLHELTEKEVEDWKVKLDLYWWYCKMDIYHSALSGDPLLMPYEQWRYCPPRGPLGKPSNICATTDHLLLILARIVDFGGKDLKRKQQIVASRGGQWVPAPGFLGPGMPPSANLATASGGGSSNPSSVPGGEHMLKRDQTGQPPSANESRARKSKSSTPSVPHQGPNTPPFYGMMPPPNRLPHMHSSYHVMEAQLRPETRDRVPETQPLVEQPPDIDMQTQMALTEHATIARAFEIWVKALGPDFEALPEAPETTVRTPFGPALRYKDPFIACTWALYYMGKILLRRLHPHSPPAAMMSAGVNAQFTRDYAQIIGRVVGGLHADHENSVQHGRFNPVTVAAMQETTFAFMFAAVQYQDAGQRGWTINKLRDLAAGTGWRSSTAVASACETTWYRMGLAGKGPPYERTLDARHVGVRMMGHQRPGSDSSDKSNPQKEDESQFASHDRDLIDRHASTRAFWAIGVLSVEEDIQKLTLKP